MVQTKPALDNLSMEETRMSSLDELFVLGATFIGRMRICQLGCAFVNFRRRFGGVLRRRLHPKVTSRVTRQFWTGIEIHKVLARRAVIFFNEFESEPNQESHFSVPLQFSPVSSKCRALLHTHLMTI